MKTDKLATKRSFLFYTLSVVLLSVMFMTYIAGSTVLPMMDVEGWVFFIASCLSHSSQLMLIPLLLALPLGLLGLRRCAAVVQITLVSLELVLCYLNEQVYNIYRFHINGFVLNMVTGPAAKEIFSFDIMLYLKEAMLFVGIVAMAAGAYWLAGRIYQRRQKAYVWATVGCFIGCTLFAHLWNIYANFYQHQAVIKSAQLLPYYFPTTADRLLQEEYGLTPPNNYGKLSMGDGVGDVCYPVHALKVEQRDSLPNIIFILIDSWNKRTLTPECMPNVYQWAQQNEWYKNHVSCSNGTRSSIFGLFFGLSCYYWETFESEHIQPLFIQQLLKDGYDIKTYVSAGMQDPPFARVIFGDVKGINADSFGGNPFENDNRATDAMISDLKRQGNSQRPFFSFLFLDLPHSYEGIPKQENTTFTPAWDYADYSKLNNDIDPTPYFNLYRNCCHYDDKLIGKVLSALREQGLTDNTIIVVSGDHAQEFNENKKNYWGHNSNFSQWQIGVPMIVHIPGHTAKEYNHRPTHYDLVPTLMHNHLGVTNQFDDYSMGILLSDSQPRLWHVVGSNLNYAFIIKGDTILEKKAEGSLDVYDPKMNEIFGYGINIKEFNKATERLNHFFKQ